MEIRSLLNRTLRYAEERDFRGWDPYDALNSPLLRTLGINSLLRILFIQAFRRSPLNLRPLFMVPTGHNPKGLGLFLSAYARLGKKEKYEYIKGLLKKYASKGYSGYAWGYNFPWQSRVFYVPPFTPTVVNTAFIGHALLDGFEMLGDREGLEMATSSTRFVLEDLNRHEEEDFIIFSYTPIDRLKVLNASLLGASLLARVGRLLKDEKLMKMALKGGMLAVRMQNEDGSWYYGLGSRAMRYIDNFHTAFNILALMEIYRATENGAIKSSMEKGFRYWRGNFFSRDMLPKYYHNRLYPLDIHSYATAIVLLSRMGKTDDARRLIETAAKRMFDEKRNHWYFQEHRHYRIKIPYMRWSIAWMAYALSVFLDKMTGDER